MTPEQSRLTLRRMAAYLRHHGADSENLCAWADFFEAMPPDAEEALAFARAQRETGYPETFTPRCDNGLYMRTYGLADSPPPSPGTLRELVALEGRDEPLAPGAYFPMDPTPVRDGLPLWNVEIRVITDDYDLVDRWDEVWELTAPRLEEVRGYGIGELPDETPLLSTDFRLWAADEAEARTLADELLDAFIGACAARRRLDVTPGYSDEYWALPRSPEDYERSDVKRRWHRIEPTPPGAKVVWFTGPCPLVRVDVDERPERVTVTLWERYPPRFAEGGTPYGIAAVGFYRCVEVPLRAPLGEREVIDGATGRPPDAIDEFDYIERNTRAQVLAMSLDRLECDPLP